jgi:hypothetical protein
MRICAISIEGTLSPCREDSMIANLKDFRPYGAVVAVGLFLSSTFFVAAEEVATSGVRLLGGSEVVLIDVSCDAEATTCLAGLAPGVVARQTGLRGINARGDIVGFYVDSANRQHGFVRHDGRYTTIDYPLAGIRGMVANGINPQGEIVGQYVLPINPHVDESSPLFCPENLSNGTANPACIKGFHYSNGDYTTIMFSGHPGAIPQRITANGEIHGCLHDRDLGMSMYGATWRRSFGPKGSVYIADAYSLQENGGELADSMAVTMSMNNGGTLNGHSIVGLFTDMLGQPRGYVVRNGVFEEYNASDEALPANLTAIWDINPQGHFVGNFRGQGEAAGRRHGFLDRDDGSPRIAFDVTVRDASGNTVTALATAAFGINSDGFIVGQYLLATGGALHGFIAAPRSGN